MIDPAANATNTGQTCFLMMFASETEKKHVRLVIQSLRAFGGELSVCPVWVFLPESALGLAEDALGLENVRFIPLAGEDEFCKYPFASKVYACARAEELAGPDIRSLAWLDLSALIVNPPRLFALPPSCDAAFRPVHIKNIGALAHAPLDDYWKAVYGAAGLEDAPFTVESFVDMQTIRPYFNTHCFAINPAKGVLCLWWESFKRMISDSAFQAGACQDDLHKIFLHQALLSALLVKTLDWQRIRLLPPEYTYPLHFQARIPQERRAQALNSLVLPVYEQNYPHSDTPTGIEIHEPLRSWLVEHAPN